MAGLARAVFIHRLGEIRDRTNLLVTAIILPVVRGCNKR